ncbi:MAG: chorismate synthase [Lachnospiraceae bacterium]|nr:chorismate synthase [Lachnospiraceae bacterium]
MAGNSFGNIFRVTTWGESHGKALGVVVDGVPAGLPLCEKDIQIFLDRRKPGQSDISTPRREDDQVEILSGVFDGKTTGTSLSMLVRSTSQKSRDYSQIADCYRPGHADYSFDAKYGFRDYRGGGRSSGRETIGRVAAGAVASKILKELGIDVYAYTTAIGPVSIDRGHFDRSAILSTPTSMPDTTANEQALAYLREVKANSDSMGGVMECTVTGLPAGVGDPVFEKLDANLAKAVMSIGAVKAVEIGDGCAVSARYASENNDSFYADEDGVHKITNHSGGTLGGLSDGAPVIIRAYVKPTPSIFQKQHTVNQAGENIEIAITGRHDPVIVPRAVVVMEAMTAITVLDALLSNMSARLDRIVDFYKR